MRLDKFKEFVKTKHPEIEVLNTNNEIKQRDRIDFFCKKHGNGNSRYDHFLSNGCNDCKREISRKNKGYDFIKKANIKHNNKYNYDKVDYIDNKKEVIINCDKHGDFKQRPDNHLAGAGCTNCNYKLSNDDFIEKCKRIHNDKYLYDKTKYNGYRDYVTIKCKKHGYFDQLARIHISGFGCPKCSESIGEKKVSEFLSNNNIDFIKQYKFDDCKNKLKLPYDFFLLKFNTCIEFNGLQHYFPVNFFGGEERFKNQLKLDKIKRDYCFTNNIKLIVISYKDNIEDKLKILSN